MPAHDFLQRVWAYTKRTLFIVGAVFLTCFAAWAAGITVPANSRLDVQGGELNVELENNSGSITNYGTITIGTVGPAGAAIRLNGDWDSTTGVLNGGTGTVYFTATTPAIQALKSGVVGTHTFNDLVHSGDGTVELGVNPLDVNGNFTNSAGTFDTNNFNITVAGSWNNTAVFVPDTGLVTLDGGNQAITGATTFYDFAKQITSGGSVSLTFPAGEEQKVQDSLTMKGLALGTRLVIQSSTTSDAYLTLNPAGVQDIRYVNVSYNNAGNDYTPGNMGLTLIARQSPGGNLGNNTNWLFGGTAITWEGTINNNWDNPYNWNLGLVPEDGDTVVIPDLGVGATYPVLATPVRVASLEIQTNASVTLNQQPLTVDSTLINAGTIFLDGTETITVGMDPTNGTFTNTGKIEFWGKDTGPASVVIDMTTKIQLGQEVGGVYGYTGVSNFHDLTINEEISDPFPDTFTTSANLTVTGDMTVTKGTVLTGAGKTLSVTGNLTISADSLTPGGNVSVTGDTLVSGGTLNISTVGVTLTASQALTISGTGTLTATLGNIVANDVTISGLGTLTAPGPDPAPATNRFTVSGNWNNTATFNNSSGTVTLNGTTQSISGTSTFYNLDKIVASADTLTLEEDKTQTVQNSLTLIGAADPNRLTILSSGALQAKIDLEPGGVQNIQNVIVDLNNATGLTLVGLGNSQGTNTTNWIFPGTAAELTWDGSASTDWNDPANWDIGIVPRSGDNVVIPDAGGTPNDPHLTSDLDVETINNLTLATGAVLWPDGYKMTVTNDLSNSGDIRLRGTEAVLITNPDTTVGHNGRFTYLGDDTGANPATITIGAFNGSGTNSYVNVYFEDTGTPDTFVFSNNVHAYGDMVLTGGTVDISNGSRTLTVAGNLTVGNGTTLTAANGNIAANNVAINGSGVLTAPGPDPDAVTKRFTVSGDWSIADAAGATFNNSSGTVTLNGTTQSISGSSIFYNLAKEVAVADTLTLAQNSTQTILNSLTLIGAADPNRLTIVSSGAAQANLNLQTGGLQNIQNVIVDLNHATGVTLVGRGDSKAMNEPTTNTNWVFGVTEYTWDGSHSLDWNDPLNWDLGLVPGAGDSVGIPAVVGPAFVPHLTSDLDVTTINNLTLESGSQLWLDGHKMTVTNNLVNSGNINLQGTEAVLIAHPDTDPAHGGSFTYLGNDSNAITIQSFNASGTNDYVNLYFADSGTLATFISQSNIHVYGDLVLTGGTLNIADGNRDLTVNGDLTIGAGTTLSASTSDVVVNGSVTINGTLSAPGAGQTFTVDKNWTLADTGTFTNNDGKVTFQSTSATTILGNSDFYDLTINAPTGKTVTFEGGSTTDVGHVLSITGGEATKVILRSTDTQQWTITVPDFTAVTDVDVANSTAVVGGPKPVILAFNSIDRKDGNGVSTNIGWLFGNLVILYPAEGTTVGRTPVIIGQGVASQPVSIIDETSAVVATTLVDANGNFRVETGKDDAALGTVTKTELDLGANTLTVVYDVYYGNPTSFTVVDAPTTDQVPTITSPADGSRLTGAYPTISGEGKPGETVYVIMNDAEGDLLLTMPPDEYAGQGTVAPDGTFTVTLTTALPRNTNYISVVVNGVSSALLQYLMNDIHGVVFDTGSNLPIKGSTVGLYYSDGTLVPAADLAPEDHNPIVTDVTGAYSFLPVNVGDYYIRVTDPVYDYPTKLANAKLPAGRSIVIGSRGEVFSFTTQVLHADLPMDAKPTLFRIEKKANKSEAKVGEVVTYTVTIECLSDINNIADTRFFDTIPPGFKFLNGRVQLDGVPIQNPTGNRPLTFDTGEFTPRKTKTLRYQLVIGSGVVPGNYENSAYMKFDNDIVTSNRATATVKVVIDSLFDAGTVFGKVFWDWNENGKQDEPDYVYEDRETVVEGPVSNVKIMMEDGTVITTDTNGQFHIPALLPGRHLFRVDEFTLPKGAYVTTDKVQVVDITPGLLFKVNFGINMDNGQIVGEDARFFDQRLRVDQDRNQPKPRLNVDKFDPEILLYNDAVLEQIEFRIFLNYVPFVHSWRLDVVDRDTKKLVKTFTGTKYNIADPIFWDGRDDSGQFVRSDHNYSYLVKVDDDHGAWDETNEKPIAFKILSDQEMLERDRVKTDDETRKEADMRARRYRDWLLAQGKVSALAKQTMMVQGETLLIDPMDTDVRQVRVLKDGQLYIDIPILARESLTARSLLDEKTPPSQELPIDMILPAGDYELEVVSGETATGRPVTGEGVAVASAGTGLAGGVVTGGTVTPDKGSITKVANYRRPVKVGEDYLMFLAMGDGKVGYNFDKGNIEPVQSDAAYRSGFYQQGKMAYYLKGKVKGKYLLTSSFDTERKQKEMFRSIKEDEYYPVYGDSSQVSYDAANTQGNLYVLLEWDKSQAIWGNYAVDFNNTEFAAYTRTLYGGKIDYTSVASNMYGDPRTKIAVFHAEIRQRSSHNEFLGTGGSLFYLKHRDIVTGAIKVKLEVRDAVTGQVRSTTEMKEGVDYDIDYSEGRILFWQPVSMSADSGRIISNNLLSGDPVYVIADYEYTVQNKVQEDTRGARIQQAVGKNVVVGATYVSETQTGGNYELKGQDVLVHVGRDTTIKAEYAETQSQDSPSFVSTDGGITFAELASANSATGKAYGITQESRLFDRLGLKSYYKWIGQNFSAAASSSQQGKELKGLAMTFDITPVTRLTATQDIQKLIASGTLQTQMQVGAQETTTTTLQLVHEAQRLRLTAEYQRQEVKAQLASAETASNKPQETVAVKAEYDLDEKTKLALSHQVGVSGEKQQQASAAISRQLTDKLAMKIEETTGTQGTATKVAATANVTPKLSMTTDFTLAKDSAGATSKTAGISGKGQLGEKTALELGYSVTQANKEKAQGQTTVTSNSQSGSSTLQTQAQSTSAGSQAVNLNVGTQIDDATIKVGTMVANAAGQTSPSQGIFVDASKSNKDGTTTAMSVKKNTSASLGGNVGIGSTIAGSGDLTVFTVSQSGKMATGQNIVAEHSMGYGAGVEEKGETYKVAQNINGRNVETAYTHQYALNQTQRSDSNIFGLTGDVNDRWAANAQLEQGQLQNIDGTLTKRVALAGGAGYVGKNEEGKDTLKSSTKVEARFDKGTEDKRQFLVSHATEGKVGEETTLTGKFEYSVTKNLDTGKAEAQYKEIVLGGAYRPIANDRLNLFARYTYKENQAPSGQEAAATDIEQNRMQVLAVEGAYELTDEWQIVEKLAYRIMEEKVAGFEFTKTHTWLLVNRANYRLNQDWKIGAEYRILSQKEAQDRKSGVLVEAVRGLNDNMELAVGYNFTDFVDDLTNLSYNVQGPYVRITGKLYDRTPEERARARTKWIERRVDRYAWRMVANELTRKDSAIVLEMNQMYRIAQDAQEKGQYEAASKIYKGIIQATEMMFQEAAQFVRKHIAFEEKLFNAYQRAQEYYDKGEYWMARKLWEKIVEEAQRSMLK